MLKQFYGSFCFKTSMAKHPQSTEKAILDRIRGHGRGWVFTPSHFLDLASRPAVTSALWRQTDAGIIRQLGRGLYDYRDHAVALTKAGRSLLESHRDVDREHRQTFHAGLVREREREHDLEVYRAYEQAEARLRERGVHIERVVLDHELKSEYQRWLHQRDGDHDDYDGHPDRTPDEVCEWAYQHDLPYFDDEVHFPDVRIEYLDPDGRWAHEDLEVVTLHYRGAHGASVARAGFSQHRGVSLRIGGRSGGRGHGGRHGGLAEELWW